MHHDTVCKISGAGAPHEFSVLPLAPPPSFRSFIVGFLMLLSQWPLFEVGLDRARRTYVDLLVPFGTRYPSS